MSPLIDDPETARLKNQWYNRQLMSVQHAMSSNVSVCSSPDPILTLDMIERKQNDPWQPDPLKDLQRELSRRDGWKPR